MQRVEGIARAGALVKYGIAKSGEVYAEQFLSVPCVMWRQGNTLLFTDISSIKQHEQQLEHIHFDALTNLPNRVAC